MQRRAGIYVRISRDRAGAGLGVQRQEQDGRALAERLGWEVVDLYPDNDLSAYSGKPRPNYRRMLDDIAGGRIDAVIAWHTDRLQRRPLELEEFVSLVERHGVEVQTVTAGPVDLSTPSGRLVARQLGAVARYEVEHSVERVLRAKEQAAAAGRWLGGPVPFGWQRTDDGGWAVVEGEAAAIKAGCEAVLSGRSLRQIARDWNDAGLRTRRTGGTWDGNSVRRVLDRPRNAALLEHRGEVVGAGDWPAIVDEPTWQAVSALVSEPGRKVSPGYERRHLGSGLYLCGVCGKALSSGASNQIRSYVCRPVKHLSRPVLAVDEVVRGVMAKRLRQPDVSDLIPQASGTGHARPDPHAEARGTRERLDELAGMFASGAIDARQLAQASTTLRARLDELEQRIVAEGAARPLAGILGHHDPAAAFLAADVHAQGAVVDLLAVVTVLPQRRGRPAGWQPGDSYFNPESVQIEWRRPA